MLQKVITLTGPRGKPCRENDEGLIGILDNASGIEMNLNDVILVNQRNEQQVIGVVNDLKSLRDFTVEQDVKFDYFEDWANHIQWLAKGTEDQIAMFTSGGFNIWYVSPHTDKGKDLADWDDGVGLIFFNPMGPRNFNLGDKLFCHMKCCPYATDKAVEIECVGHFTGKVLFGWWLFDLTQPRIDNLIADKHYNHIVSYYGDTWCASEYYD